MHEIKMIYLLILSFLLSYELVIKVPLVLQATLLSSLGVVQGIVWVMAIVVLSQAVSDYEKGLGFLAVTFSTYRVLSGYLVTVGQAKLLEHK